MTWPQSFSFVSFFFLLGVNIIWLNITFNRLINFKLDLDYRDWQSVLQLHDEPAAAVLSEYLSNNLSIYIDKYFPFRGERRFENYDNYSKYSENNSWFNQIRIKYRCFLKSYKHFIKAYCKYIVSSENNSKDVWLINREWGIEYVIETSINVSAINFEIYFAIIAIMIIDILPARNATARDISKLSPKELLFLSCNWSVGNSRSHKRS